MTDNAQTDNQRFLGAALEWLRSLLRSRTEGTDAAESQVSLFWRRTVPAEPARSSNEEVRRARQALEEVAKSAETVPFAMLSRQLGLSAFEQDVLLLAAAIEIDSGIARSVGEAQQDPMRRAPTFELCLRLFEGGSWDALSPTRPLRGHGLIEMHQSGAASMLGAQIRIDERIAAYIKGLNYLDERIAALASELSLPASLPNSQLTVAGTLARRLRDERGAAIIQLVGPDNLAKRDVTAAAAAMAGHDLVVIAANAMPTNAEGIDTFVKLWNREARLLRVTLYIEGLETRSDPGLDGASPPPATMLRTIGRLRGGVMVETRYPIQELAGTAVVEVGRPTEREQQELWHKVLSGFGADASEAEAGSVKLAGEFSFAASRIAAIVEDAKQHPPGTEQPLARRLRAACMARTRGALDSLAERIEPRRTLDDLILPPQQKELLGRIITQAGNRSTVLWRYGFLERSSHGLGTIALFHGESGTGKTMAAEAVANALGLVLYRLDVSRVVSKYIGETEKQLRRCFDDADAGGKLMFLDECDSLAGKRSEVKDSHDRYANIEISYLLQRLESFRGVAILATNMRHALDAAFLRRLRFVVGFPFPGVAEREAIWRSVFPVEAPLGDVEWDRLARFSISGGSIFNAAFDAAHAAAAANGRIEMPHLLDAIRLEMNKLERPLNEAEFRWNPRSAKGVAA
ncbi:ATP-binding protein [Ensifer canadensis]